MHVSISNGNAKLGQIKSVSLPAGVTCRSDAGCASKCYARRLERIYPSVNDAYKRNYELLLSDPDTYWREVEASIMMSRFFRFHVSGDIVDDDYFKHVVDIAKRNRHCEVLLFTKKYEIVNKYTESSIGDIPSNLHILFSVWEDLRCENPYRYPEAHVRFRDGSTTASADAIECGGSCSDCAITDGGCWSLTYGQQVVFNEH